MQWIELHNGFWNKIHSGTTCFCLRLLKILRGEAYTVRTSGYLLHLSCSWLCCTPMTLLIYLTSFGSLWGLGNLSMANQSANKRWCQNEPKHKVFKWTLPKGIRHVHLLYLHLLQQPFSICPDCPITTDLNQCTSRFSYLPKLHDANAVFPKPHTWGLFSFSLTIMKRNPLRSTTRDR